MSKKPLNVQAAYQRLVDGNGRFQAGLRSIESLHTSDKMRDLAENGQSPFGIILSCSDSRVPAEMIFDQGMGDLFIIRIAGNIVAPSQVASIEFSALNYKSPICIVMGHSNCGAVNAALSVERNEKISLTPNLEKLVAKVRPAARLAMKRMSDPQEVLQEATWINVRRTVRKIREQSEAVRQLELGGQLMLIGAVYDLHTGQVVFDEGTANSINGSKDSDQKSKRGKGLLSIASDLN